MKTKKPKKHTYEDLARIACELEARVIWALKFMRCPGSGMVAHMRDGEFKSDGHWTSWFADGVEMLGRYKITDRELLGVSDTERNRIIKQRERAAKASAKP